jgi:hypothetical protein
VISPEQVVLPQKLAGDSAQGYEFLTATVGTSGPLGAEPFAQLGLPPSCTNRISGGFHDRDDQTTEGYSFPMYSLTSTLTGPFQFLSESPNL